MRPIWKHLLIAGQVSGGGVSYVNAELRFAPLNTIRIKASDVAALGDGVAVATIPVRHTAVNAIQGTAGNRPTYEDISGKSALTFVVGDTDYLTTDVGAFDVRRGITIIVLADARNTGRMLSCSGSASNEFTNAFAYSADVGLVIGGNGGVGFSTYADYTVNSSGLALFTGRFGGGGVANWLNGVKRNGTVSNATELSDGSHQLGNLPTGSTSQLLQFGRRLHSTTNLYWDGDLYDVLIVNAVLTDEEVAYLEGVIAWDNGATSLLPSDHAWKNIRPYSSATINYIWGAGASIVTRAAQAGTLFIGSPSLCRGSDGTLYALCDYPNAADTGSTGALFTSSGLQRASLSNFHWGTIWLHTDGYLYILATTRTWGDLQIGKSTDGGVNWTWTTLSASGGPLAAAGATTTAPNYHRGGGIPPLYHDGHIFAACENLDPFNRDEGFQSFVLYAPDDVDLMDKANWSATSQLAVGAHSYGSDAGMFEGNIVVDDTGQLYNMLRWGTANAQDKAVFLPLTWNGTSLSMPSWNSSYVKDFPGGNVKFQVVKYNGYFYSLTNDNTGAAASQRNRVTLLKYSAANLSSPAFATDLVVIDQATVQTVTGMNSSDSAGYHGFQYASFIIENGVVRVLYRVAWSGAVDYHSAQYLAYAEFALP